MTYKIFKKINMALLGIIFLGICAVAYADKIMDSVEKKVDKAEGLVKAAQQADAAVKNLKGDVDKTDKEANSKLERRKKSEEKVKKANQKVKDAKDDTSKKAAEKEAEDAWKKFCQDCDEWWDADVSARRKRDGYNKAQKKKAELLASANAAIKDAEDSIPSENNTTQPARRNKQIRRLDEIISDARRIPPPVKIPPEPTVKTPWHTLGYEWIFKIDPKNAGVKIISTGKTINDVATISLINKTNNYIPIIIPPTILLSISGKSQNYAVTQPLAVWLGPKETKQLMLDGICVDPDVPPVKKGAVNESKFADITDPVFSKKWDKIVNETKAIEKTCEELQKEGQYKTPFSSDPKKERDTIVQWTTWLVNSQRKGKPITKADLEKQILKQVKNPTKDQTEQIKKGADDIWKGIELTKDAKPLI